MDNVYENFLLFPCTIASCCELGCTTTEKTRAKSGNVDFEIRDNCSGTKESFWLIKNRNLMELLCFLVAPLPSHFLVILRMFWRLFHIHSHTLAHHITHSILVTLCRLSELNLFTVDCALLKYFSDDCVIFTLPLCSFTQSHYLTTFIAAVVTTNLAPLCNWFECRRKFYGNKLTFHLSECVPKSSSDEIMERKIFTSNIDSRK